MKDENYKNNSYQGKLFWAYNCFILVVGIP